ncbi:MAG: MgtC/SapB family protein [Candidatus Acidiferrum sp.]|jgi:putative Mg2+ transporter-C (MgtC) family protein
MLSHHFAIRLGVALLLGAIIGAERQWRQRMVGLAGLRTNALVAAGAAIVAAVFRPVMFTIGAMEPQRRRLLIYFGSRPERIRKLLRALLPQSLSGHPLFLKSLESDDVEHTDKVEVHAILTSTGRENVALEQIVGRLSLESDVSGVS